MISIHKPQQSSSQRTSILKLPPLDKCRLSIQNILTEADANCKHPANYRYSNFTDRPSILTEHTVHSTIREFKQNYSKMFTHSKYGVQYMQRKIFHKLEPL